VSLARRNLFQNKTRLGMSVTGVALSVMLILVLNGFLGGVYRKAGAYLDNTRGSVIVVQDSVRNVFATSSVLPSGVTKSVRETDGVSKTIPIASQFVIFELHDEKQLPPLFLYGGSRCQGSSVSSQGWLRGASGPDVRLQS
jgi:putative ABC transport system permease protein